MSASGQALYLKIDQNSIVRRRQVTLQDVAKMECADLGVLRRVMQMDLHYFSGADKKDFIQVFSVLKVIKMIHGKYPSLEVVNLGAPDFVVRYVPEPEKKGLQYIKVAFLCAVLFFGSAFTIMTFIQDVSVTDVFSRFYFHVTGKISTGVTPLEIGFCIGLAGGIIIFYNHIGRKKITDDPTPIQVEMRKYEQDVDSAYIETSGRKGKSIDVDS